MSVHRNALSCLNLEQCSASDSNAALVSWGQFAAFNLRRSGQFMATTRIASSVRSGQYDTSNFLSCVQNLVIFVNMAVIFDRLGLVSLFIEAQAGIIGEYMRTCDIVRGPPQC